MLNKDGTTEIKLLGELEKKLHGDVPISTLTFDCVFLFSSSGSTICLYLLYMNIIGILFDVLKYCYVFDFSVPLKWTYGQHFLRRKFLPTVGCYMVGSSLKIHLVRFFHVDSSKDRKCLKIDNLRGSIWSFWAICINFRGILTKLWAWRLSKSHPTDLVCYDGPSLVRKIFSWYKIIITKIYLILL